MRGLWAKYRKLISADALPVSVAIARRKLCRSACRFIRSATFYAESRKYS